VLFNITGGNDLSMYEVDEAARIITEASDAEANIIFGAVINDSYTGEVKITVVATGFDASPRETANFRSHSSLNSNYGGAPSTSGIGSEAGTSAGEPQPVMKNAEDELDIPAFIRKKMG